MTPCEFNWPILSLSTIVLQDIVEGQQRAKNGLVSTLSQERVSNASLIPLAHARGSYRGISTPAMHGIVTVTSARFDTFSDRIRRRFNAPYPTLTYYRGSRAFVGHPPAFGRRLRLQLRHPNPSGLNVGLSLSFPVSTSSLLFVPSKQSSARRSRLHQSSSSVLRQRATPQVSPGGPHWMKAMRAPY